ATIRSAIQESPASRDLQVAYADILSVRGKTDESITLLQTLGGSAPDLDLISAIVGVYEHAERYTEAQATLDSAAAKFPESRQVFFLQGVLYERQDKIADAERSFRKALELDENNPSVLNYLGYMLADHGLKLDEALGMIRKAVAAAPRNGAFLARLGRVYLQ